MSFSLLRCSPITMRLLSTRSCRRNCCYGWCETHSVLLFLPASFPYSNNLFLLIVLIICLLHLSYPCCFYSREIMTDFNDTLYHNYSLMMFANSFDVVFFFLHRIFSFLDVVTLCRCAQVSRVSVI